MSDKALHINGCPFCDIYTKDKLPKKIYFLCDEFLICDWLVDGEEVPMVIYSSHVTQINKSAWGRLLYRCRKAFGETIKLIRKPHKDIPFDHWSMIVDIKNKEDI